MSYHATPRPEPVNPFKDNTNIIPIAVIASFTSDGKIVPLYCRIKGEQYKIENIIYSENSTNTEKTFRCQIIIYDRMQEITIHYHMNYAIWTLDKQM